jgi:hypothetical protein
MPQVRRLLHPLHVAYGQAGSHILGDATVEFDADGLAEVDDAATLAIMHEWPETFSVVEAEPAPEPLLPGAASEAALAVRHLEGLPFRQLQDVAASLGVPNVFRTNKRDLITAILAAQAARQSREAREAAPGRA